MGIELSEIFLTKRSFFEHHQYYDKDTVIPEDERDFYKEELYFMGKIHPDNCCFRLDNENKPNTSYFIGIDWLSNKYDKAIYVEPKLNKDSSYQTNYLEILFSALKYPEVIDSIDNLFEIKWDQPQIEINQKQDLLTPLLVVEFLQVLRNIVRKGLKKTYYRVQTNLNSKIKGKILIGQTIKNNLVKNNLLNTCCSYDEFGYNGLENRLLKKALIFVQRYLPSIRYTEAHRYTKDVFNYINPAFENISDEVSLYEVKIAKTNAFYKEYEKGIMLAKIILRRFGYNINTTQEKKYKIYPFWIDMSKLFELYVLGLLKACNEFEINYQFGLKYNETTYGQPDFLLIRENPGMIIDAKYKPCYQRGEYDIDNLRQLSCYARDSKILDKIKVARDEIADCLIIYPLKLYNPTVKNISAIKIDISQKELVKKDFIQLYKLGVELPVMKNT